jgi:hypothetical protein
MPEQAIKYRELLKEKEKKHEEDSFACCGGG